MKMDVSFFAPNALQDLLEQAGIRITFRKGDTHKAHTEANVRADLEQLQANGIALCSGHCGTVQPQTAQRLYQHIGERRKI